MPLPRVLILAINSLLLGHALASGQPAPSTPPAALHINSFSVPPSEPSDSADAPRQASAIATPMIPDPDRFPATPEPAAYRIFENTRFTA